jgi:thiol-disulfide isomerase/thioredoxin
LAGPAGVALPVVEVVVAALLVPAATAWWGALGALALLLAFVGGIANVMRQGRAPECHCFGQLSSEPVGVSTLVRNCVLAVPALFIVIQGPDNAGPGVADWWRDLSGAGQVGVALGTIMLALFAIQGWLLFQLVRQNGRLLLRLDALEAASANPVSAPAPAGGPNTGLPVGSAAPNFHLSDLAGLPHSLSSLWSDGKPLMLVFADAHCGPCTALMPDVGVWQRDHAEKLAFAVITRGSIDANREKIARHGIDRVLVQQDREVATAYNSLPTPSAVVIRPNGTIGSPAALGADAIRALLQRVLAEPAPNGMPPRPVGLPVGTPAPELSWTMLGGDTARLADFNGSQTLVTFWNPQCGFCKRMLPELQRWESDRPEGAPNLLVVSRGSEDDNAALGLRAPIALDQESRAMQAFGSGGTPSAVLIDAEGKVASAVALGADAVFALARSPEPIA